MTPEEKKALQLTAVSVREGILTGTHGAKADMPQGGQVLHREEAPMGQSGVEPRRSVALAEDEPVPDGRTKDVMNTEPVDEKFAAFGCDVVTINGHDFEAMETAFARFHANKGSDGPERRRAPAQCGPC